MAVTPRHGADALLAALRTNTPPLIARIVDATVCLDLRTVPEARDAEAVEILTLNA